MVKLLDELSPHSGTVLLNEQLASFFCQSSWESRGVGCQGRLCVLAALDRGRSCTVHSPLIQALSFVLGCIALPDRKSTL